MNMKSLTPYLIALGISAAVTIGCDSRSVGTDNSDAGTPDSGLVDSGITPDAYSPLTATLNVLPNPTREGDLTQFECIASGGVPPYESFEIDFGDGDFVETDYAQHVFDYEDNLLSLCTVRDSEGNTAIAESDVEVLNNPPVVDLVASVNGGFAPLTVDLDCQVAGGNAPIDFNTYAGEGDNIPQAQVTHTFTEPGIYDASCGALDADGDFASDSETIEVLCGCVDVEYQFGPGTMESRTACVGEGGKLMDQLTGDDLHYQEPSNNHFYGKTQDIFALQMAGIPNIHLHRYLGVNSADQTATFENIEIGYTYEVALTLANGVYEGTIISAGFNHIFEIDPTTLDIKVDLDGDGLYTGGNTQFAEGTCLRP